MGLQFYLLAKQAENIRNRHFLKFVRPYALSWRAAPALLL